jgi:hypothetical protein
VCRGILCCCRLKLGQGQCCNQVVLQSSLTCVVVATLQCTSGGARGQPPWATAGSLLYHCHGAHDCMSLEAHLRLHSTMYAMLF